MLDNMSERKKGYWKQKHFLEELAKLDIVRIAGSYARGEQNIDSDIDFQIKDSPTDNMYNKPNRYVEQIKKLLDKFGYKWESTRNEYMNTNQIPRDDNSYLLYHMEFYTGFWKNKNKLKEVEILGVKFKTH